MHVSSKLRDSCKTKHSEINIMLFSQIARAIDRWAFKSSS